MPLSSIHGEGRPLPGASKTHPGFFRRLDTLRFVPARKVSPNKFKFRGTPVPYQATAMEEDPTAKLQSISAMQVYSHKSVEELRMEDYCNHDNAKEKNGTFGRPPKTTTRDNGTKPKATLLLGPTTTAAPVVAVKDDLMEWEESPLCTTMVNDNELAMSQAVAFQERMATDLVKEEWKDLAYFVTTSSWNTIRYQLFRVFLLRLEMKRRHAPELSIGYHYTTEKTVQQIREHGLMTRADRWAAGVADNFFGAAFGDGCYTGNDPIAFYNFREGATVGLVVLRLMGRVGEDRHDTLADTLAFSGRARHSQRQTDYVILRKSQQCAVLAEFDGTFVFSHAETRDKLMRLQTYFEETIDRVLFEHETSLAARKSAAKDTLLVKMLRMHQEMLLTNSSRHFSFLYTAPQTLSALADSERSCERLDNEDHSDSDCPICLDALEGDIYRIKGCTHIFHKACVDMVLKKFSTCPVCRTVVGEPQGTSPSGEMIVVFDPKHTSSNSPRGFIKISYAMTKGIQKSYHANRGVLFADQVNKRVAYVPDTTQGRELLQRLVYAFLHGLTFTVGTSLSSGRSNVVTWGSIHHKTALSGAHGFPDPQFLVNCHGELTALGVPESNSTLLQMQQLEEMNHYISLRDKFAQA